MRSERATLFSFKVSTFLNLMTPQYLPGDGTDRIVLSHHTKTHYIHAVEPQKFHLHLHQNSIPVLQPITFLVLTLLESRRELIYATENHVSSTYVRGEAR